MKTSIEEQQASRLFDEFVLKDLPSSTFTDRWIHRSVSLYLSINEGPYDEDYIVDSIMGDEDCPEFDRKTLSDCTLERFISDHQAATWKTTCYYAQMVTFIGQNASLPLVDLQACNRRVASMVAELEQLQQFEPQFASAIGLYIVAVGIFEWNDRQRSIPYDEDLHGPIRFG